MFFGQFLCPSSGVFHCTHSKPVWHIPLLRVQWKTPDDGHRNCPKHVEFYSKNKFEKLTHLVGFIIRSWICIWKTFILPCDGVIKSVISCSFTLNSLQFLLSISITNALSGCSFIIYVASNVFYNYRNIIIRYLNNDIPTWCHLFYYFTIYCSTCFEC